MGKILRNLNSQSYLDLMHERSVTYQVFMFLLNIHNKGINTAPMIEQECGLTKLQIDCICSKINKQEKAKASIQQSIHQNIKQAI
mmetsp:Transcript_9375/g.7163  ORF Transcript_9375/g.7163 Transcript_9375/m.7163 type:complete len:85 (+) Transcript_9375:18-272(+)